MKWKTPNSVCSSYLDKRFAWRPTPCSDGYTYWLTWVKAWMWFSDGRWRMTRNNIGPWNGE